MHGSAMHLGHVVVIRFGTFWNVPPSSCIFSRLCYNKRAAAAAKVSSRPSSLKTKLKEN